jgi:hypothetical protein
VKIHPAKQGTREWLIARAGLPTASQFDRILTPKTMKASSSQEGYMHQLLAEWLLGMPDQGSSDFMKRGTFIEGQAVSWYELQRDVTVERVGLVTRDDDRAGCSPDGLVGADGGLELKCPSAKEHVGNLLSMTGDYRCQVQGGMWITGRAWWDLVSFNPDLPSALVRFERSEAFISLLEEQVLAFSERLEQAKRVLAARGISPVRYDSASPSGARDASGGALVKMQGMGRSPGRSVGGGLRFLDPEPF